MPNSTVVQVRVCPSKQHRPTNPGWSLAVRYWDAKLTRASRGTGSLEECHGQWQSSQVGRKAPSAKAHTPKRAGDPLE